MAKTTRELIEALRGYEDAAEVSVPKDGHDLVVTRPDGSTVAIPIGLE